jgi:hypothetical protein
VQFLHRKRKRIPFVDVIEIHYCTVTFSLYANKMKLRDQYKKNEIFGHEKKNSNDGARIGIYLFKQKIKAIAQDFYGNLNIYG